MSTHNICFHGEIRKILCGYPLLSVAMAQSDQGLHCLLTESLDTAECMNGEH